MARTYEFEIQAVSRAFSGRVPEHLWKTVGRTNHVVTASRTASKWRRYYTPQPGSWSGHVRVLRNGKHVVIEPNSFDIHEVEG